MGFLRRLLGGPHEEVDAPSSPDSPPAPAVTESDERERERLVVREEHERLDELARRQLRYADYSWQPPAQGGERRADDAEGDAERG
ncbi:MAG TPA: hypothetical protein VIB02_09430 [Candidatus Limnocylindrales bacterium]|jgi:hypothetical protein